MPPFILSQARKRTVQFNSGFSCYITTTLTFNTISKKWLFSITVKGTRSRSVHARIADQNLKKQSCLFEFAFTNSEWRLAEDPDMAVNALTQGGNERLEIEGNTRKRG